MSNYPVLRNLLISIFSVDVGLEETEEMATLERVLADNNQRLSIEKELKELFHDQNAPWMELVENDEYVAYPPDDEDDAKEYILEKLWVNVFPNETAP